jgi:hypothetical protein
LEEFKISFSIQRILVNLVVCEKIHNNGGLEEIPTGIAEKNLL